MLVQANLQASMCQITGGAHYPDAFLASLLQTGQFGLFVDATEVYKFECLIIGSSSISLREEKTELIASVESAQTVCPSPR